MFDAYDFEKLKEARELLLEVFDYNYGDTKNKTMVNRLETIVNKLNDLLVLQEEKRGRWKNANTL